MSSINNQYISETTTTPSDFISQHSGTILNKSYLEFSTTYSYRNFLYYKKSAVYYTNLDGDTVNKALGKESESDTWKTEYIRLANDCKALNNSIIIVTVKPEEEVYLLYWMPTT